MGLLTSAASLRLLTTALVALSVALAAEQAATVKREGAVVRVRLPAFTFIEGDTLARLRDGRALQIEFTLAALTKVGAPVITETRQSFNVSFDLWEERFAVTWMATPRRSVSHLGAREAEAWCLERLALDHAEIARLGRNGQFWIRLAYEIRDPSATQAERDDVYSLRRLIDYLSQRRPASEPRKSMDAGPFRVPE